jgi:hypothetical protein
MLKHCESAYVVSTPRLPGSEVTYKHLFLPTWYRTISYVSTGVSLIKHGLACYALGLA